MSLRAATSASSSVKCVLKDPENGVPMVLDYWRSLLRNDRFTDLKVYCGSGGTQGAGLSMHAAVLAACSPFLAEVIGRSGREDNVLILPDCDEADVSVLVQLLYGDESVRRKKIPSQELLHLLRIETGINDNTIDQRTTATAAEGVETFYMTCQRNDETSREDGKLAEEEEYDDVENLLIPVIDGTGQDEMGGFRLNMIIKDEVVVTPTASLSYSVDGKSFITSEEEYDTDATRIPDEEVGFNSLNNEEGDVSDYKPSEDETRGSASCSRSIPSSICSSRRSWGLPSIMSEASSPRSDSSGNGCGRTPKSAMEPAKFETLSTPHLPTSESEKELICSRVSQLRKRKIKDKFSRISRRTKTPSSVQSILSTTDSDENSDSEKTSSQQVKRTRHARKVNLASQSMSKDPVLVMSDDVSDRRSHHDTVETYKQEHAKWKNTLGLRYTLSRSNSEEQEDSGRCMLSSSSSTSADWKPELKKKVINKIFLDRKKQQKLVSNRRESETIKEDSAGKVTECPERDKIVDKETGVRVKSENRVDEVAETDATSHIVVKEVNTAGADEESEKVQRMNVCRDESDKERDQDLETTNPRRSSCTFPYTPSPDVATDVSPGIIFADIYPLIPQCQTILMAKHQRLNAGDDFNTLSSLKNKHANPQPEPKLVQQYAGENDSLTTAEKVKSVRAIDREQPVTYQKGPSPPVHHDDESLVSWSDEDSVHTEWNETHLWSEDDIIQQPNYERKEDFKQQG